MELGSARDMVRNPEELCSFMQSPFLLGLARMTLENHRKQILNGQPFWGRVSNHSWAYP